jgi:hypothetical protein
MNVSRESSPIGRSRAEVSPSASGSAPGVVRQQGGVPIDPAGQSAPGAHVPPSRSAATEQFPGLPLKRGADAAASSDEESRRKRPSRASDAPRPRMPSPRLRPATPAREVMPAADPADVRSAAGSPASSVGAGRRLLACESTALAFLLESGSGSEPLAEFLFDFHEEALEHSSTYRNLVQKAEDLGKIAVSLSDDDLGGNEARTSWVDGGDDAESFHLIEMSCKGIDRAAEAVSPEERDQCKKDLATHWFVNELNNAALHGEFDARRQAARRGEYATEVLVSETDQRLADVEKHITTTDRLLARHGNDGPAVHYARETERVEFTFFEKYDAIHQEIVGSTGRPVRELSPGQSFEEYYREQVETGHSREYLSQYDRITGRALRDPGGVHDAPGPHRDR